MPKPAVKEKRIAIPHLRLDKLRLLDCLLRPLKNRRRVRLASAKTALVCHLLNRFPDSMRAADQLQS